MSSRAPDLPPDIDAVAGLYGIEQREDGLFVPAPPVESTYANTGPTEPLSLEAIARIRAEIDRMALRDGIRTRSALRAWVAAAGAAIGCVAWLDEIGPGRARLAIWPGDATPAEIERFAWQAHDEMPAGVSLEPRICESPGDHLPLPWCTFHDECKLHHEMAIDCWRDQRRRAGP